jgi:hypothetical protein
MFPVGFEPTILVSERPKTHTLDRTATGIGQAVTTQSYFANGLSNLIVNLIY